MVTVCRWHAPFSHACPQNAVDIVFGIRLIYHDGNLSFGIDVIRISARSVRDEILRGGGMPARCLQFEQCPSAPPIVRKTVQARQARSRIPERRFLQHAENPWPPLQHRGKGNGLVWDNGIPRAAFPRELETAAN